MHPIYKIVFYISISLVIASIAIVSVYGLNFGVDFKGGTVMEIEFKNRPALEALQNVLRATGVVSINYYGDNGAIIRTVELSEEEHQVLLGKIRSKFEVEEKRFQSVGPVVGQELRNKSIVAIILVLTAIIIYIAFVFRKLSKNLSPWAMGVAAIVALAHDILIPLGIFSLLGKFYGVEITAVFIAAVLTVLGYSVSDSVVVFDRVRENVIKGSKESFDAIVHKSVMQTLVRSINNTLTVVLSSAAIFFFGGDSIKYFALSLMLGIFLGAYSSIFVASPLLVAIHKRRIP